MMIHCLDNQSDATEKLQGFRSLQNMTGGLPFSEWDYEVSSKIFGGNYVHIYFSL